MIVTPLISQKGGVGKTLIAASLATALSMRGYRVWLIDLDPNATLSRALGISNPGGVSGALTYVMGLGRSVKVFTAVTEDGAMTNVRVIPPGATIGNNPYNALPSTAVLTSRLGSLISGVSSYRAMPNFIIIDTPALTPSLSPGLLTAIISNSDVITLVATDEPGGMGWLGKFLEYSSTVAPTRRQDQVAVLNKLTNLRGAFDVGVRYTVKILRNPAVEAAWRMGLIPYLVKDPELAQFRKSIDELAVIMERLNAEYTWVGRR